MKKYLKGIQSRVDRGAMESETIQKNGVNPNTHTDNENSKSIKK
jgi:hypothetical protein